MEHLNSENYSPFEALTENFGQSETAWDDFSFKISSMPISIQDLVLGISAEEFILDVVTDFNLSENQSKNQLPIVGFPILTLHLPPCRHQRFFLKDPLKYPRS